MSEQIAQQSVKSSFLKKQFFNFRISEAIRNCNKIGQYLLKENYLSKYDSKLSLIISDGVSSEVDDSYLLYKGYNKDGSLNPIRKFSVVNNEILEYKSIIMGDIIIIDLYEKSIYLHSYINDNEFITGYLIKEEIKSSNKTLIFSNEKVIINVKNINKFDTNSVVDDFVNKYII
ncbi:MAG: hypothetical protein MUO60_06000 [Clostridiaceae bacterium]|nr:hypothetical protein [Clostridiaceae bacterium]